MKTRVTTRVFGGVASIVFLAVGALSAACGDDNESTFLDPNDRSELDGGTSNSGRGFTQGDTSHDERDAQSSVGTLEAIIRDFKIYDANDSTTNPDFENVPSPSESGKDEHYEGPWTEATADYFEGADYAVNIVQPTLGADGKPVYNEAASINALTGRTVTTHGKAAFDQWYRDVPGVNVRRSVLLTLTKNENGAYTYDSAVSGLPQNPSDPSSPKGFWPIDDDSPFSTSGDGFGNQGNHHNYHFTVELRTRFTYRGTETFKFSGDDDVFVFINKKLVINIGGIHGALEKEIRLSELADELGLVPGEQYPLDFFQAERHVTGSNLRIDTTLELEPAFVK